MAIIITMGDMVAGRHQSGSVAKNLHLRGNKHKSRERTNRILWTFATCKHTSSETTPPIKPQCQQG